MFEEFYHLTGRPFQLTPDANFYFESATHRKALSYLGYGLAQGEGFIVITGEVGAGKSTLVAHLMKKVDPAQMSVGQIVTSALDGEEMIHVAAQAFGLDVDGHDKARALGAIEGFLHEEARAGRRCLLVVDESQNLSVSAIEELRMLSNFQLGSHPLLQTLLLGQPEFRDVLQHHADLEQLRQRVIASHHLGPMEPNEIEPYIRHRLECVGWQGSPEIDPRVYSEIYEPTGGIPRRINQVMTRLLLLGAVEQRTRIDYAMLTAVLKEIDGDNASGQNAAPGEQGEGNVQTYAGDANSDDVPVKRQVFRGSVSTYPQGQDEAQPQQQPQPQPQQVFVDRRAASTADPVAQPQYGPPAMQVSAQPHLPGLDSDHSASAMQGQPGISAEEVHALLKERDSQIVQLQEAIGKLIHEVAASERTNEAFKALSDKVEHLAARVDEQEESIRQTLVMMIEWIETGKAPRFAA